MSGAPLQNAPQDIELTLGKVRADAAQPGQHQLRDALLMLSGKSVMMPARMGQDRSERFDLFELTGKNQSSIAVTIQVDGKPDVFRRLQKERDAVAYVWHLVASGAIASMNDVFARLLMQ